MKKIFQYIFEWCTKPQRYGNAIAKPVVVNFPITDNCNSRCVMCNVWKDPLDGEMTPDEIFNTFSDQYYSKVKHLGISGGEPTLRNDLEYCIDAIIDAIPNLHTLSVTSHGFHTSKWGRLAPIIINKCKQKNIEFSVNISVDGIDDIHNRIRGVPGAFEKVQSTIQTLLKAGANVQLQCTVSKDNVYHVSETLDFARNIGVEIVFRCATEINRLYNKELIPSVFLSQEQRSYLADFFSSEVLLQQTKSLSRKLYYDRMSQWLVYGGQRHMPCAFQKEGVLITSLGEAYSCSVSDEKLACVRGKSSTEVLESQEVNKNRRQFNKSKCKSCIHDQSGAWSPYALIKYQVKNAKQFSSAVTVYAKIAQAIKLLLSIIFVKASSLLLATPKSHSNESTVCRSAVNSVLIIGAYGGEHVGDAAILGGVILRTLDRYPKLSQVFVSSFRPDRTRVWVRSLNLPVDVTVIDESDIKSRLRDVESVIYGGGPLMELPLHLLKHYATMFRAKRYHGNECIVEGVGIGPIKTWLSNMLVKKIILLCDSVVVRTEASATYCKDNCVSYELKQDPAFDYLYAQQQSRKDNGIKSTSKENVIIAKTDSLSIGINLRPLWNKYSFNNSVDTKALENEYITTLAAALKEVSVKTRNSIAYNFFPMNADQYGMSDFLIAYELKRKLKQLGIDLNIWHVEPTIDDVIGFIEKQDAIIAMRFHACIFALSVDKHNVISIDYQIGKDGKVTDVMRAHSANSNGLYRVDQLSNRDDLCNEILRVIGYPSDG